MEAHGRAVGPVGRTARRRLARLYLGEKRARRGGGGRRWGGGKGGGVGDVLRCLHPACRPHLGQLLCRGAPGRGGGVWDEYFVFLLCTVHPACLLHLGQLLCNGSPTHSGCWWRRPRAARERGKGGVPLQGRCHSTPPPRAPHHLPATARGRHRLKSSIPSKFRTLSTLAMYEVSYTRATSSDTNA